MDNKELFTTEAFKIYFNTILKIVIGVLAILSYLTACFGYGTKSGLNFAIIILALTLGLYYIIASMVLWLITNIVSMVATIIFFVIAYIVLDMIVYGSFSWLEEIGKIEGEKQKLIEFVKDMKH